MTAEEEFTDWYLLTPKKVREQICFTTKQGVHSLPVLLEEVRKETDLSKTLLKELGF